MNVIFLLEDLLEERDLELHVRGVQSREIHINISHEMREFPVLPEKINIKHMFVIGFVPKQQNTQN